MISTSDDQKKKKNSRKIEDLHVGGGVSKSIKLHDENIGEYGKEELINQNAKSTNQKRKY